MRSLKSVERSFIRSIVDDTRRLLNSHAPVSEKLARLHSQARRQGRRIAALSKLADRLEGDAERSDRIHRLISLREMAIGYFRATARYVEHQDCCATSLRQWPRLFALPSWHPRSESRFARVAEEGLALEAAS